MRTSQTFNPRDFLGNITLIAVVVLFLHTSAAGQACGGDQSTKSAGASHDIPEQFRGRYGWLYHPVFAKVALARLPPELNDPPEKLRAPFGANGDIVFRLLIRNISADTKSLILDGTYRYDRPALYKDGALVPYRQDALDKIRATDNPASGYSRFEQLGPGQEFAETIKLGDWYKPLQPGRYELKMCRRFIWGGEWLESPPLAFDVVP